MYIRKMALNPIPFDGRTAIAVIGDPDLGASFENNGEVFLLDSQTGSAIGSQGSTHWMSSNLCTVSVDDEVLLAGGCMDGTIQLWEPRSSKQVNFLHGHRKLVTSVCQIDTGHSSLLASSSSDGTIRLWNSVNGEHIRTIQSHDYWPDNLCAIGSGPDSMLASSADREIRLWNPVNGSLIKTLEGCPGSIYALCAVDSDESLLLASGECTIDQVLLNRGEVDADTANCAVRLWNPVSGEQVCVFEGHSNDVKAVCSFSIRNRCLLASAGGDGVVRIWDIASRASILAIPVHYSATSMIWADDSLFIGLDGGVLAIKLEDSVLASRL